MQCLGSWILAMLILQIQNCLIQNLDILPYPAWDLFPLEEIYFPNDSIPILLNKKSEHLKFIQKIRNEAHRFAISYHKNLRSTNFIKSELDNIFGIGEKTKFKLLQKYASIEKIKKIKFEYLAKEIGNKKAKSIIKYLKEKN